MSHITPSPGTFALAPRTAGKKAVGQDELLINAKDYGAVSDDTTDAGPSISTALAAAAAGQTVLLPTGAYYIATSVSVPANITLKVEGNVRLATNIIVTLDGAGARLTGPGTVTAATASVPSYAVRLSRDGCWVDGVAFTGTARTTAIRVAYDDVGSATTTITGGGVRNCTFNGTAYGVLKLFVNCSVFDFTIRDNVFRNIVGGDAIEWNLDAVGYGLTIQGNTIDSVTRGSVVNAGIAIGVAGQNATQVEANQFNQFSITGNNIANVGEGVHVEGCHRFLIANNITRNAQKTTGGELSGSGVVVYNSTKFAIDDNQCYDSWQGVAVLPASGKNCADFVVSNNAAYLCAKGTHIDMTGTGAALVGSVASVAVVSNHSLGCTTYSNEWAGTATWFIRDNTDIASAGQALTYVESGFTTVIDNVGPYIGTAAPSNTSRLWVDTT